jgi:hypothetical protein
MRPVLVNGFDISTAGNACQQTGKARIRGVNEPNVEKLPEDAFCSKPECGLESDDADRSS